MWRPTQPVAVGLCAWILACGSRSALQGSDVDGGGAPSGGEQNFGGAMPLPSNGGDPSPGGTSPAGGAAGAGGSGGSGGNSCEPGSALEVDGLGFPSRVFELPCEHGARWEVKLSGDGQRALLLRDTPDPPAIEAWAFHRDAWSRLDTPRIVNWKYLWVAEESDSAWIVTVPADIAPSAEPGWVMLSGFNGANFTSRVGTVRQDWGILETKPITSPSRIVEAQLDPSGNIGVVATASDDILITESGGWNSTSWPGEPQSERSIADVTRSRVGVLRRGANDMFTQLRAFIRHSDGLWQRYSLPDNDGPYFGQYSPNDFALAQDGNVALASWSYIEGAGDEPRGMVMRLSESGTWEFAWIGTISATSAEGPGLALSTAGDLGFVVTSDCDADCKDGRIYASTWAADDWVTTPVAHAPRCSLFGHVSLGDNGTRAFSMLCTDGAYFVHSMGASETWHQMLLPVGPDDVASTLPHVSLDRLGQRALITWRVRRQGDSRARLRATLLEF